MLPSLTCTCIFELSSDPNFCQRLYFRAQNVAKQLNSDRVAEESALRQLDQDLNAAMRTAAETVKLSQACLRARLCCPSCFISWVSGFFPPSVSEVFACLRFFPLRFSTLSFARGRCLPPSWTCTR